MSMFRKIKDWITKIRDWMTLTPLRIVVASVLGLGLLGSAGFGVQRWVRDRHYCGADDVVHLGSQCIGVTDGRYLFGGRHSPLAQAEAAIQHQDHLISKQRYVTIALLQPMTDPNPAVQAEILHEVQGAYAAQVMADNRRLSNDAPLGIRLVLANPGVNSTHWQPVVQQLAGMTRAPDNLRVVFGIGVSTTQTEQEVAQLTRTYHIPVVLGARTANDFANQVSGPPSFPGLARVSPTDEDEAVAITRFAQAKPEDSVLVEDDRHGDTPDDYISSLISSYRYDTMHAAYPFTSAENESMPGDVAAILGQRVDQICMTNAKWVYFAGRQVQLRIFLNALAEARGRECNDRKFTVITGDAAAHLTGDTQLWKKDFSSGGITLDYPAIASPETASSAPTAVQQASEMLRSILNSNPVGRMDLTNGVTIVNYDAALTAIAGISKYFNSNRRIPSLADVSQEWSRLMVYGASGVICLDSAGNPYDKAIAIMQRADSRSGYVSLAWPDGSQLGPTCDPPIGS